MSNEAKEAVCVCGHPVSIHTAIHGRERGCRGTIQLPGCVVECKCMVCRPCLPWPTEEGWWWMNCEGVRDELVEARMTNGAIWLEGHGEHGLQDYWPHGPARFTRLLEPNPFTT